MRRRESVYRLARCGRLEWPTNTTFREQPNNEKNPHAAGGYRCALHVGRRRFTLVRLYTRQIFDAEQLAIDHDHHVARWRHLYGRPNGDLRPNQVPLYNFKEEFVQFLTGT
jgi:hypothetical protein